MRNAEKKGVLIKNIREKVAVLTRGAQIWNIPDRDRHLVATEIRIKEAAATATATRAPGRNRNIGRDL